jgi:hypothetical protein
MNQRFRTLHDMVLFEDEIILSIEIQMTILMFT